MDSSGCTPKEVTVSNISFSNSGSLSGLIITQIINRVREKIYGFNGTSYNYNNSIVFKMFDAITTDIRYLAIAYLGVILFVAVQGFKMFIGKLDMSLPSLFSIISRVFIIGLFVSPQGWYFYRSLIMEPIINVGENLSKLVLAGFMNVDPSDIENPLFILDYALAYILSWNGLYKMVGLIFSGFWGILYVIVIIWTAFSLVIVTLKAVLLYASSVMIGGVLLALGPIMFILAVFEETRSMFTSWLKNLIGIAFQQYVMFIFIFMMSVITAAFIKNLLYYQVCWGDVFAVRITIKMPEWLISFIEAITSFFGTVHLPEYIIDLSIPFFWFFKIAISPLNVPVDIFGAGSLVILTIIFNGAISMIPKMAAEIAEVQLSPTDLAGQGIKKLENIQDKYIDEYATTAATKVGKAGARLIERQTVGLAGKIAGTTLSAANKIGGGILQAISTKTEGAIVKNEMKKELQNNFTEAQRSNIERVQDLQTQMIKSENPVQQKDLQKKIKDAESKLDDKSKGFLEKYNRVEGNALFVPTAEDRRSVKLAKQNKNAELHDAKQDKKQALQDAKKNNASASQIAKLSTDHDDKIAKLTTDHDDKIQQAIKDVRSNYGKDGKKVTGAISTLRDAVGGFANFASGGTGFVDGVKSLVNFWGLTGGETKKQAQMDKKRAKAQSLQIYAQAYNSKFVELSKTMPADEAMNKASDYAKSEMKKRGKTGQKTNRKKDIIGLTDQQANEFIEDFNKNGSSDRIALSRSVVGDNAVVAKFLQTSRLASTSDQCRQLEKERIKRNQQKRLEVEDAKIDEFMENEVPSEVEYDDENIEVPEMEHIVQKTSKEEGNKRPQTINPQRSNKPSSTKRSQNVLDDEIQETIEEIDEDV